MRVISYNLRKHAAVGELADLEFSEAEMEAALASLPETPSIA